jgi:hypothetical protein
MSRKMLKGGGQEDNLLYKIKDMEIDINNPSSDKLNELEKHLETLKTFQPKMLSISIIREIVDKFKLDVNVPSKNLTVTEEERSNLVSNLQIKMLEYITSKRVTVDNLPPAPPLGQEAQSLDQQSGGGGTEEEEDDIKPRAGEDQEENVVNQSVDSNLEVLRQPKKLSDIEGEEIGYTIEDGVIKKNVGDPAPGLGEKQKAFINKKSQEIKEALADSAIKDRVKMSEPGKTAIVNYNDAMDAAKGYLGVDFTPIQGGKRTRRHRSKTRNRRTKNKRRKQYKR